MKKDPSAVDEHGLKQSYYESIMRTYIRELGKAHKGVRRLVRRCRRLEDENARLRETVDVFQEALSAVRRGEIPRDLLKYSPPEKP